MSRGSDDLTPFLVPPPTATMRFGQGRVISWDPTTLTNVIEWQGTRLEDLPVLAGIEALGITSGDTVGLAGWDPGGQAGNTQWFVLGRLHLPGEDAPDVEIRGASVIVRGGGQIVVQDSNGNNRVAMGLGDGGGQIATAHANGTAHMLIGDISSGGVPVGQGVAAQQDDGTDIFSAFANPATGNQQFRIWDHDGNVQVRTDEGGSGLDEPWMDIPLYPISSLGNSDAEGSSFSPIWLGGFRVTHRGVHLQARAWVSPATTGEVRYTINGTQVGNTETITSETAEVRDFGGDQNIPSGLSHYGNYSVQLEGRVTSGTGSVFAMPVAVQKRGSI